MLRGVTKDVSVFITELRSLPVIETKWETYPYYYKVVSPMFIQTDSGTKLVKKNDYLVWNENDNFEIFKSSDWQNLFGKFLKENLEEMEYLEKKN